MLFRRSLLHPSTLAGWSLLLALVPAAAPAQSSPFLPPADAAAPAKSAAKASYEFVGMTELGNETLLSFTRVSDKVSVWIPLGKTINEITVVSYDAKTDTAVIKANGETLTLTMRKGTVVAAPATAFAAAPAPLPGAGAGTPAPAAAEPAIVVPKKPLSVQEEKELEARMLVTDLLEIGLRQRQAYAEAQRQAALKAANAKMPAAPAAEPTKR